MEETLKKIIDKIENNRVKGIDSSLSSTSSEIGKIITKPFEDKEISEEEAVKLFLIEDSEDLASLVIAADNARKEDVGDDVTYVVNRNINFTNICKIKKIGHTLVSWLVVFSFLPSFSDAEFPIRLRPFFLVAQFQRQADLRQFVPLSSIGSP